MLFRSFHIFFVFKLINLGVKKLFLYLSFLIISTCAKEDSQALNTPPSQITSQYTLKVSAGDGGSVSTTGGIYNDGTSISIVATASEGYEFIGWTGSESTSSNITLTISSNITISANFEIDCSYWQRDIPDWEQTSYELFDIYYPQNYQDLGALLNNQWGGESGEYGLNVISVDYNNDGYIDIIGSYNDYSNFIDYPSDYYGYERKQLIRFYKGSCGGNFEVDELNDSKFLGLVHGRKILLGDFNDDNYVDLFLLGHGYDKQPFNGEFNKVLMSNGDGSFFDIDFQSLNLSIMVVLLEILITTVTLILWQLMVAVENHSYIKI